MPVSHRADPSSSPSTTHGPEHRVRHKLNVAPNTKGKQKDVHPGHGVLQLMINTVAVRNHQKNKSFVGTASWDFQRSLLCGQAWHHPAPSAAAGGRNPGS